jgi:8-amino-7-oxononanoate synthase
MFHVEHPGWGGVSLHGARGGVLSHAATEVFHVEHSEPRADTERDLGPRRKAWAFCTKSGYDGWRGDLDGLLRGPSRQRLHRAPVMGLRTQPRPPLKPFSPTNELHRPMTREWFEQDLRALEDAHRLRVPRTLHYRDTTHAEIDGRPVTVFCSNDYLGLRNHPRLLGAVDRVVRAEGIGTGASRLVSGNLDVHREAEATLAEHVASESALLFSSGFAANVGVIPVLAGADDVLFSDALNHASLVDGCRLSRARTIVFRHGDAAHLAESVRAARPFRRGWILTESVFSMDGDRAPLGALRAIADREGLGLYVDEAHALGVLGAEGRGAAFEHAIRADVLVGTLGKALGGAGAFVAGAAPLRSWLWNRARSFVFSTGASVANAAAATEAILLLRSDPRPLQRLRENIALLREGLGRRGLPIGGEPDVPIVPIILGDERRAVEVSQTLLERGLFVSAIRPPTVPVGTARLRITVSAAHTVEELNALCDALEESLR